MNYCSKCGEKYGKTTKFCTNCGTDIQFSVPEDSELIDIEEIQDEVLDGIFEGIVSDRKVKDGMVIYSMKIDESNTNSDVAELAANIMTIEYLENDSIDLTTVNGSFIETVQLNRVD